MIKADSSLMIKKTLPKEAQDKIDLSIKRFLKEDGISGYSFYDSTVVVKEADPFISGCPICTGSEFEKGTIDRKREIFCNPKFIDELSLGETAFLVGHEVGHRTREGTADEFYASLTSIELFKDRKLGEELASRWYYKWWYDQPIVTDREVSKKFQMMLKRNPRKAVRAMRTI